MHTKDIGRDNRMHTNAIFKCKHCKQVSRQAVESDGMNYRRPEGIPHAGEWDARPFAQCACGYWIVGQPIVGKHNPEVVCDGRCMGATGPNCECSCGGANHGANHG